MLKPILLFSLLLVHFISSVPTLDNNSDPDCDDNDSNNRDFVQMKWISTNSDVHLERISETEWQEFRNGGFFEKLKHISEGQDENGKTVILQRQVGQTKGFGVKLTQQAMFWGESLSKIRFFFVEGHFEETEPTETTTEEPPLDRDANDNENGDEDGEIDSREGKDGYVEVKVWPPLSRSFPDDTSSDSDLTSRDQPLDQQDDQDDDDCQNEDEDNQDMYVNHDGSKDLPTDSNNRNGQGQTPEDVCPMTCKNKNMTWTGTWGSIMVDDVTTCKCNDPKSSPEVSRQSRISIQSCEKFLCDSMLAAHNRYRSQHRVGGLFMDRSLSSSASNWAANLARTNGFQHSNARGYGENLAAMTHGRAPQLTQKFCSDLGNAFTKMWYDEIKFWDFGRGASRGGVTGHFTQLVWKSSRNFGCGLAIGQNGRRFVNVGQYKPPGNVQGQYRQNVFQG